MRDRRNPRAPECIKITGTSQVMESKLSKNKNTKWKIVNKNISCGTCIVLCSLSSLLPPLLSPPSRSRQTLHPHPPWAGFCSMLLPVKREFFIATVTKSCSWGKCWVSVNNNYKVWSRAALYEMCTEIRSVTISCYINKVELNWIESHQRDASATF